MQIGGGGVRRTATAMGAWVIDDGRAKRRMIEIGHRNDETAEVLSGLREAERVIVHPADDIAEGVRVRSR